MQYETPILPEFQTKAQLSQHYARVRKGFYDEAAVLRDQAAHDAAEIKALHRRVGDQLEEYNRLARDIAAFQAEINKKRAHLKELKIELRVVDLTAEVDKITFEVNRVLDVVATAHNLSIAEIKGHRRDRRAVTGRFHAIGLLGQHRPDLSLSEIGRIFGNRNHTTIMHARSQWHRIMHDYPSHIVAVEAGLGILASQP